MDPLEQEELKMQEMLLAIDEVNNEEDDEPEIDDKVTVTDVD